MCTLKSGTKMRFSMKKKMTLAALCAAGLFLFAGCTAQAETEIAANWLRTPSDVFTPGFYEKLTYAVEMEKTEDTSVSGMSFELDAENSSYYVETEAPSSPFSHGGTTYNEYYKLHSVAEISGTYTYTDPETGETSEICSFGGENDTPASDADDAIRIERTVYFRTTRGDDNLEPIYSENDIYSFAPAGATGGGVALYSYSYTIGYNAGCTEAAIDYTDNFAGLSAEELQVSEGLQKGKVLLSDVTVDDLQRSYTVLDNAQLYFAGRGIALSADAGTSLAVVSGENGLGTVSLTASGDPAATPFTFTMDGEPFDGDVTCTTVSISVTSSGANSGLPHSVKYASTAQGEDGNSCYAMPMEIAEPFGYGIGSLVYTLREAVHTK